MSSNNFVVIDGGGEGITASLIGSLQREDATAPTILRRFSYPTVAAMAVATHTYVLTADLNCSFRFERDPLQTLAAQDALLPHCGEGCLHLQR